MAIIGEYLSSSRLYVKHPPAASGWLTDGRPLDSGTGMIFSNNLSVLEQNKTRQLVSSMCHLQAPKASECNYYYEGLIDATSSNPTAEPIERQVGWRQDSCLCFGPFFMVPDVPVSRGGTTIRPVTVNVGIGNAVASNVTFLFFLTPSVQPPSEGYFAYSSYSTSVSGALTGSKTIQPSTPIEANCTMVTDGGSGVIDLVACYLWVGIISNHANTELRTINAWEERA